MRGLGFMHHPQRMGADTPAKVFQCLVVGSQGVVLGSRSFLLGEVRPAERDDCPLVTRRKPCPAASLISPGSVECAETRAPCRACPASRSGAGAPSWTKRCAGSRARNEVRNR